MLRDGAAPPLMAGVYAEDSLEDHGDVQLPGRGLAAKMGAKIVATSETLTHMPGQSSIRVDGEGAGAETYFLAVCKQTDTDGTPMVKQPGACSDADVSYHMLGARHGAN